MKIKTLIPIGGALMLLIAFASCKKGDNGTGWICTCSYNHYGQKSLQYDLGKQSKNSAKNACDEKEKYYQSVSGASGATCSL